MAYQLWKALSAMEPKSEGEGGYEAMLQPFDMMISLQSQNC